MQIDHNGSVCPSCGRDSLRFSPVLHHMVCAYVGPDYDFTVAAEGLLCPKCQRVLRDDSQDAEVVGSSTFCPDCGAEAIVAPDHWSPLRPVSSTG